MRIAVFNVKYSPNLGDGLLAECLEAELRASGPDIETVAVDLAGRTGYGEGGLRNRKTALTILDNLPGAVRRIAVGAVLRRMVGRQLRPAWRTVLANADAVVVGGGNLLADSDLNFPIKLEGALAEAAAVGVPVGVYGVGVADNWSQAGEALFRRGLTAVRLVYAAVRDVRSQAVWQARLGPAGVAAPSVCRDPAMLTALHFPRVAKTGAGKQVALGLTDPLALRYHGGSAALRASEMTDWMLELVRQLVADGWRVSAFTNGSPEDRTYLSRLESRLRAISPDAVSIAPAFERPSDLAAFISGQDLVMAHRLHACIAAYAYAVPHIGFTWDIKLNSFFESVGHAEFVADAGVMPVEDAVALAERAFTQGVDAQTHARNVAVAREEVAALAKALRTAAELVSVAS